MPILALATMSRSTISMNSKWLVRCPNPTASFFSRRRRELLAALMEGPVLYLVAIALLVR